MNTMYWLYFHYDAYQQKYTSYAHRLLSFARRTRTRAASASQKIKTRLFCQQLIFVFLFGMRFLMPCVLLSAVSVTVCCWLTVVQTTTTNPTLSLSPSVYAFITKYTHVFLFLFSKEFLLYRCCSNWTQYAHSVYAIISFLDLCVSFPQRLLYSSSAHATMISSFMGFHTFSRDFQAMRIRPTFFFFYHNFEL